MSCGGWSRCLAAAWSVGLILAGGCGGGSGGQPIAATTLAGMVGGQPWTLVGGETDAFLSSGEPDFFTTLYAESVTPCTGAGFSVTSNEIILQVPMATGDSMRSVTFVVDPSNTSQNFIVTGHVVVDEVTATSVSGGVYASYDDDNVINGQFQATICAQ